MIQKNKMNSEFKRNRIVFQIGFASLILIVLVIFAFGFGIWSASNQILFPVWKGISKDFKECNIEGEKAWGKFCGNLRLTKKIRFREIQIPSINGYHLPGWYVETRNNGVSMQKGVILLVHGGGSDRRELTRLIPFYLNEGFDILSFDLSCHGEAPCVVPGLSFGNRESRDVLSAYLYLTKKHHNILMYGSSVGASSILISLPFLNAVKGIILENPMISFERLIFDSPESAFLPNWMLESLISLVTSRGKFDMLLSPENSLRFQSNVPLLFIHSKNDIVVPYRHSEHLGKLYSGPSEVWLPVLGSHGKVWETNPTEYESKIRKFFKKIEK